MTKLSTHQKSFLTYVYTQHESVGYNTTVARILKKGSYTKSQAVTLQMIVTLFKGLVDEMETNHPQDTWNCIDRYNTPFKYING